MEGNTSYGSSGGGAEISAAASGAGAAAEVAAGMEEECPAGMQKNPGRGALWVKPEKALEVMMEQKRKGKALYWKDFKPVIAEKGGQRLCWLQCTKQEGVCGKLLSIQNPARSASDHSDHKQLQDCRNHLARFFYKGAACSASRCVLHAQ